MPLVVDQRYNLLPPKTQHGLAQAPKKVALIRLSGDIMNALASGQAMKIENDIPGFPFIIIGGERFPLKPLPEDGHHELHGRTVPQGQKGKSAPLHHIGNVMCKLNGALSEQDAQAARTAALGARTRKEMNDRQKGRIVMLEEPLTSLGVGKAATGGKGQKKTASTKKGAAAASSSSNTQASKAAPPLPGRTTSSTSVNSKKDPSLYARMFAMLALKGSCKETDIIRAVGGGGSADQAHRQAVLSTLSEMARPTKAGSGTWEIQPSKWKEARPYDWPLAEGMRDSLVKKVHAKLEEFNVPDSDPVWRYLSPPPPPAPPPAPVPAPVAAPPSAPRASPMPPAGHETSPPSQSRQDDNDKERAKDTAPKKEKERGKLPMHGLPSRPSEETVNAAKTAAVTVKRVMVPKAKDASSASRKKDKDRDDRPIQAKDEGSRAGSSVPTSMSTAASSKSLDVPNRLKAEDRNLSSTSIASAASSSRSAAPALKDKELERVKGIQGVPGLKVNAGAKRKSPDGDMDTASDADAPSPKSRRMPGSGYKAPKASMTPPLGTPVASTTLPSSRSQDVKISKDNKDMATSPAQKLDLPARSSAASVATSTSATSMSANATSNGKRSRELDIKPSTSPSKVSTSTSTSSSSRNAGSDSEREGRTTKGKHERSKLAISSPALPPASTPLSSSSGSSLGKAASTSTNGLKGTSGATAKVKPVTQTDDLVLDPKYETNAAIKKGKIPRRVKEEEEEGEIEEPGSERPTLPLPTPVPSKRTKTESGASGASKAVSEVSTSNGNTLSSISKATGSERGKDDRPRVGDKEGTRERDSRDKDGRRPRSRDRDHEDNRGDRSRDRNRRNGDRDGRERDNGWGPSQSRDRQRDRSREPDRGRDRDQRDQRDARDARESRDKDGRRDERRERDREDRESRKVESPTLPLPAKVAKRASTPEIKRLMRNDPNAQDKSSVTAPMKKAVVKREPSPDDAFDRMRKSTAGKPTASNSNNANASNGHNSNSNASTVKPPVKQSTRRDSPAVAVVRRRDASPTGSTTSSRATQRTAESRSKIKRSSPVYTSSSDDEKAKATTPAPAPVAGRKRKASDRDADADSDSDHASRASKSSKPVNATNSVSTAQARTKYRKLHGPYMADWTELAAEKTRLQAMLERMDEDSSVTHAGSGTDEETYALEDLEALAQSFGRREGELRELRGMVEVGGA